MSKQFQKPRGTEDVLPAMQPYWIAIHKAIQEITQLFGYSRIDTPIFEDAALFEKGTGDTTDIIEKEMYSFADRGGDFLALTPEATPALCRAYLENGMGSQPQPVRLYTTAPMFRYDRPQQGRLRQFTQFDCEVLGSGDPYTDAELIELLWGFYEHLGLTGIEIRLSSIDDLATRKNYIDDLLAYYQPLSDSLSEDSQRRLQTNPLRLLDSKDERDLAFKEKAPKLIDRLSEDAAKHFETVKESLTTAAIPFTIDPLLVRGLDYYNRTVFEFVPQGDNRAQNTIGAGGRYDGLMKNLGGPSTPAVGFAAGFERIILEMQRQEKILVPANNVTIYIAHLGTEAGKESIRLASALRKNKLSTVIGESTRSLKAQLRKANTSGVQITIIIGEEEMSRGTAIIKSMRTDQAQVEAPLNTIPSEIIKLLNHKNDMLTQEFSTNE